MKFYCKPTLTLFLLLYVAIQSAQAQDTLRITLQDAVRIALSDNPTIKVAGSLQKYQFDKYRCEPGGREITCFTSGYGKSSDQGIFSVAFGTGQL